MSNITDLFKQRDALFAKATDNILEAIPHVLDGIVRYLNLRDEIQSGNLSWEEAMLFPSEDGGESFIMIVGVISYNPGEKFELPDHRIVEINENTADYFKRLIRIGIPVTMAENGTDEDIFEFLKKTEDAENAPAPEPMSSDPTDFDLTELTDEQRKALELFEQTAGKKS